MERRGIRRGDPGTWPPLVEGMDDLDGEPFVDDVGRDDAPTRLLCGSHLAVPQFLAPHGEAGADSDADFWRPSTLCRIAAHATGKAGDVFLCHPFIVHTATWPHRGAGPRMIAQPAINAPAGFALDGSDPSPVARAIVKGLTMAQVDISRVAGLPLTPGVCGQPK
jgi:hypothetical protein